MGVRVFSFTKPPVILQVSAQRPFVSALIFRLVAAAAAIKMALRRVSIAISPEDALDGSASVPASDFPRAISDAHNSSLIGAFHGASTGVLAG